MESGLNCGWLWLALLEISGCSMQSLTGEQGAYASSAAEAGCNDAPKKKVQSAVYQTEPGLHEFDNANGSAWTFVVLPDTQMYSRMPDAKNSADVGKLAEKHHENLTWICKAQTEWIAANTATRNIKFVLHEGDLVDDNNVAAEWQVAKEAMQSLHNVVPYVVTTGNHDYGVGRNGNSTTRDSEISKHFPVSNFFPHLKRYWSEERDEIENAFYTFDTPQGKWLVVALEWGPRDTVVEWANQILKTEPYRSMPTIFLTHAYLAQNGMRYEHNPETPRWQNYNPHIYKINNLPGGVNDGEELWNKLVKRSRNIRLVLSGHDLGKGTALLTSQNLDGLAVHQIFANYQHRRIEELETVDNSQGDTGYLRLMEVRNSGKEVHVFTYSPVLDNRLIDDANQFDVDL